MTTTIYTINRPYTEGVIEIYALEGMGAYEWRIIENGKTLHDTGRADGSGMGMQYGSPEIALRDALNDATRDVPSDDFRDNVSTWKYKGNLFGGIDLLEHPNGDIEPLVSDYTSPDPMAQQYSGGRFRTWREAFAAFGTALDQEADQ